MRFNIHSGAERLAETLEDLRCEGLLSEEGRAKVSNAFDHLRNFETAWIVPSSLSTSNVELDEETQRWLERDFNLKQANPQKRRPSDSSDSLRSLAPSSMQTQGTLRRPQMDGKVHDDCGLAEGADGTPGMIARRYSWHMDPFQLKRESKEGPLYALAEAYIQDYDLVEELNISRDKLHNFLLELEKGYNDVPYHNSTHAADVLHAFAFFARTTGLPKKLTSAELLAAFLACAVHDFKHPGLTNNFLISSGNELARRYNDKSVLENFHVAATFELLDKPETDITIGMDSDQRHRLRRIIIDMVLATDMSHHFEFMSKLKSKLYAGLDLNDLEDRILYLAFFLKCADVSNPAKGVELGSKWAHMLARERLAEANIEAERNGEVGEACRIIEERPLNVATNQLNFIEVIAFPIFETLWCAPHAAVARFLQFG